MLNLSHLQKTQLHRETGVWLVGRYSGGPAQSVNQQSAYEAFVFEANVSDLGA